MLFTFWMLSQNILPDFYFLAFSMYSTKGIILPYPLRLGQHIQMYIIFDRQPLPPILVNLLPAQCLPTLWAALISKRL